MSPKRKSDNKKIAESKLETLKDIIAPSAIEVTSNYIKIGTKYAKTMFIFTYPKYLTSNWFSPIINMDYPMDISFFIHPTPTEKVMKVLQRQLTSVEAETMEREEKGLIRDPVLEAAYQNIEDLRDKLQTAEEKMFKFGLYITLYGDTPKKLEQVENELRAVLESRMVYIKPALYQQKAGFNSCLPLEYDELLIHNSLNTSPLSSTFPFVSFDLSSDKGILYGINRHNNSLILFDRFSLENANMVIFAKSGGGKSVRGNEPILIKDKDGIRYTKIGPFIEKILKQKGVNFNDEELVGNTNPQISVYTFDENLRGAWSKVILAARKKATPEFYQFTTASGRKITTTGDHNVVILKDGKVINTKSTEVKKGNYVPLPRFVPEPENPQTSINLIELFKNQKGVYVKNAQSFIIKHYPRIKKQKINARYDKYLYKYKKDRRIPLSYLLEIHKYIGKELGRPELKRLKLCSQRGEIELDALYSLTPELLRLWGYIVSEGTVGKKFVQISNKDEEFLKDLEQCLTKLHIPHYKIKSGILIGSPLFTKFSRLCGVKGYSHQKEVPPAVFCASNKLAANFLKAYFEGDGWVDGGKSVMAVSKSQTLISQLTFLLYRFGIVGRIKTKQKKAQGWLYKKDYYEISISGSPSLKKFSDKIGFMSNRKKLLLSAAIKKNPNTNVDVVPEMQTLFETIYQNFGFKLSNIRNLSPIKRGIFAPSQETLKKFIREVEVKIQEYEHVQEQTKYLEALPDLKQIIQRGNNKAMNRLLWKKLGQSWRLMKNRKVQPYCKNALKALQITHSIEYGLAQIKNATQERIENSGLAVSAYGGRTQAFLLNRPAGDACYTNLKKDILFTAQRYQKNEQCLYKTKQALKNLKTFADSQLYWDPIVDIKKIKNKKDKYVYDLTVNNGVFLAGQGGMFVHNSYFTKLEILRSMMLGTDVLVIDPENEYRFLAETVGGSFFKISLTSEHHINPFDLPPVGKDESAGNVLRSNIIILMGLLKVMLGEITAEEESILDSAITETYSSRDITPERRDIADITPPLMTDLETVLENMEGGESLAIRLKKYTEGIYSGFLNQPTNVTLDNQLVVFNIRDMEDELRPVAMFIILNYIWGAVRKNLKKRTLVVDEAWWMMQHEDSAAFLFSIAKRARKYFLGLTTITQDIADFMGSSYGKPIVTNSSLQLLLKQSPASVNIIQDSFNLTDEEKFLLLESNVGEGLFFAGNKHVAIKIIASYTEDQIITSDPEQLLKIEKAKEELEKEEEE